ncbi:hypothetical protein FGO68_gene15618 [Halteria grandinella]|uniref:Uncharacterized protein n=1 Tax=Halteria grandinella TaxID=5974 RepID=A0A8J8T926_HALGN|nr:hypothetical protein FGO68_gene15618 [Halteria grandinella]
MNSQYAPPYPPQGGPPSMHLPPGSFYPPPPLPYGRSMPHMPPPPPPHMMPPLPQSAGQFSTLNNDVIPDPKFIEDVEGYQPKFNMELIESLMREVGMQSSDERVYKMISIIAEAQLCKILNEVKTVNIQAQKPNDYKSHLSMEELARALEEFGIFLRRPPFLEDRGVNASGNASGEKKGDGQRMIKR